MMDFKEIIKKSEIHKAPEGFSDRLMVIIKSENLYAPITQNNDLLSGRQKLFILSFLAISLIASFFLPASGDTIVPGSLTLIVRKIAQMAESIKLESNLSLLVSLIAFLVIIFLSLDMVLKKGFSIQVRT